jgi:hypothetical protein
VKNDRWEQPEERAALKAQRVWRKRSRKVREFVLSVIDNLAVAKEWFTAIPAVILSEKTALISPADEESSCRSRKWPQATIGGALLYSTLC